MELQVRQVAALEQVAQVEAQASQVEVAVFKNVPAGQVDTQVFPWRYPERQVKQVVVVEAQVAQGEAQA